MNLFHSKITQFIIVLISLGLCLSSLRTILDLWRRKDLVGVRQRDLITITQENQRLEKKLKETQGDDYIERIARDKLGMVKDGESIVLLPESGIQPKIQSEAIPNWKKWWKMFF